MSILINNIEIKELEIKEIQQFIKKCIKDIINEIKEWESLAPLGKEICLNFCNSKIKFSYIDSSVDNKLFLLKQYKSEDIYKEYIDNEESLYLLKKNYVYI